MSGETNAKSPHSNFYYYRGNELRAIRSGVWKLHIAKKNKKQKQPHLTLYNLANDISERNEVSAKNQEVVKRLYSNAQAFDKDLKSNGRPPGKITEN